MSATQARILATGDPLASGRRDDSRGDLGLDSSHVVRSAAMAVIVLISVVGAQAFHDLRATSNISTSESGNLLNQVLFVVVALIVVATMTVCGLRSLRPLASWPAIAVAVWFAITTVVSSSPTLSIRRLILLLICMSGAACIFLLARSVRHLATVIAGTFLCIVAVCYVSLVVVPELSIHSIYDLREPEHDGSWRGVFPHKNEAGAIMVLFIFAGLLATRVASPVLGWTLVIASGVFLAFTRAKTPIGLLPLVLLQSWLCVRWTSTFWRSLVFLGPIAFMLLISVGTIYIPPVKSVVDATMPDPSFTGRTQIWQFAADSIQKRPVTGFGFGAFWQTEATFYGNSEDVTWVNQVGDAHDGFLNVAVETGFPGLILTVVWLMLEPIYNMQRARDGPALDALSLFFVRCLFCGLLSAVFEGVLYHSVNGGFFIITVAMFGLRLRTRATLLAE